MYSGKIGAWTKQSADIANEIASEYGNDEVDYIAVQARALAILGGEILPSHTWEEFDAACAQSAEELNA